MLKVTKKTDDFSWIQVSNPSTLELQTLVKNYHATSESLSYAIDENERARAEIDEENNIFLIIFHALCSNLNEGIQTEPAAFMFLPNAVVVFTHDETHYVNKIMDRNAKILGRKNIDSKAPFGGSIMIDVVFNTIYELTMRFNDAVSRINYDRQAIQAKFKTRLNHSGIQSMLQLETSLIYLLTSLKSNTSLLNSMMRLPNLNLTKQQRTKLEEIIIESEQSQEMAQLSSDIIEQVSKSYSDVLDNNLNNTMKFLTILSIVLAVPNIVFGFYGQNVSLPFANSTRSWELTILISIGLILIVYLIVNWSNFFKK
ncbi:magnesium transporter CorA family protein [Pediococcus stilesii]|uniref:Mg2+ and Co2+ transporter n=1 Tax=Pediococcus stilesii TaxID=331679 RepID=A0A0R2KW17_9LACO|nr:magnesium transporter CorA family protein [Pediococcus stilesii]KRN93568.1 Mg2+ and Co2+ transporter [Pediococcus stilesii]